MKYAIVSAIHIYNLVKPNGNPLPPQTASHWHLTLQVICFLVLYFSFYHNNSIVPTNRQTVNPFHERSKNVSSMYILWARTSIRVEVC